MDAYKQKTGNRFPTCGEVLEILASLNYVQEEASDDPEEEFNQALSAYKSASGRMFPTCSEVLEVILGLRYRQPNAGPVELSASRCVPFENEP